VEQAGPFLSQARDLAADLYITASNTGGDMPGDARRFVSMLEQGAPRGLRWKFEWMKDETHGSISLPSVYRGLNTIFDGWHLTDPVPTFDNGGIEAVHRHFREGGARCGYKRTTPPFTVSLLVAGLMKSGRLDEAARVLMHDPKAYPPPWNQLDALARAYEAKGDLGRAAQYYELSLKQNPQNERAKRKLAELRQ
jgi:tetratricopeptide (TPR) repeat protein